MTVDPVSAFRPGLCSGEEKAASAVSAGADLTEEGYTVNYTRLLDSGRVRYRVGHALSAQDLILPYSRATEEPGRKNMGWRRILSLPISYIIKPEPVSITVSGRKVYQWDPIGGSGFIVTWPGDEVYR